MQGFEADIAGENEQEDDAICKFCRRHGFHWEQTPSGWRLATETGKIHECKAYQSRDH
jgi:hypothetical protein